MEKCRVLGLRQEKYKISLGYLVTEVVTEGKKVFRKQKDRHGKKTHNHHGKN